MNRVCKPAFQYYIPTEEELRNAHIHRSDSTGKKLEKRFGHPALHAELFTPMVHANMTHLLAQVYSGKIDNVETKLDDIGGQEVDARVVAGGIKIAGIDEVSLLCVLVATSDTTGPRNDILGRTKWLRSIGM